MVKDTPPIVPKLRPLLRRAIITVGLVLIAVLAIRIVEAERGPPLRPWHSVVPDELTPAALDATDWAGYLAAEDAAFETVRREVTDKLSPEDQVAANRYFAGSPLFPPGFATDWNRSFLLLPERAEPVGVVVLFHGLTDAPYSMRHLAMLYRAQGFVALGLRLPGHGTVPGGLTAATWEQWVAAARLAVREARARVGQQRPLHLVGYSNGGAVALKYTLDSLADPRLARPDRVLLLSPMISVTAAARFAGLAAVPALLPAFAKTAWLDRLPEFNPFKYNSFPANAARQTFRFTAALQAQLAGLARDGRLAALPPVLTFQSVVDATVSTAAVVNTLYAQLPANGSELVLFDLNRNAKLGPLVTPGATTQLDRLLPAGPQRYRMTVVTNAAGDSNAAEARATPAGGTEPSRAALGLAWPRGVFSLSHVALPFPVEDGLYGLDPDPADDFGVTLGALALRGERGVLVTSLDSLNRIASNPFFPYLRDRLTPLIAATAPP